MKFLKKPFLQNTSGRLLLDVCHPGSTSFGLSLKVPALDFFSWLYPKSDNDTKVCVWFVKKPNKHDKIDLRNKKNKTKAKQQNNASLIIYVKDCLSYKKIFFRCKIKWMLDYFSLLRSTSSTSLYQQSDEIQCCEGIQLPYSKIPEQLFL